MNKFYKLLLVFAFAVGGAAQFASAQSGRQVPPQPPTQTQPSGQPSPAGPSQDSAQQQPPVMEVNLTMRGVDGKTYDLAEMRGNVLLVSFGASWCAPCASELRALEQLKQEYGNRPVKIVWVSIEREGQITDKELRGYAKQNKLTFPVLRDTTNQTFAFFSPRRRIPTVVFFDAECNMVGPAHTGMSEPEAYKQIMRRRIDALLATSSTRGRQIYEE